MRSLMSLKGLFGVIAFAIFVGTAISIVTEAATTATVTATVTAQNIAVSVSDGTVTYGTLATSGTASTSSDGLNDSQTATNDGNITSDFDIQGSDSAAWTLAASIGSEQYVHEFCTSNCDAEPTWTALTTSYQALATSVAAAGTTVFDLKIIVPSSTATYTQQSVDATVQVSAS